MGISYVFKKFTPQDKAIIPFNAHKQYNFTSASAASNKVTYYHARYTSESISTWSGNSGSNDTINNIKYNQIDHLFYRDHLKKYGTKKDPVNYLKNRRELYESINILSIPVGLYGSEIKKSTFYVSSSKHKIIDDSYGNLIVSGTNTDLYPTDVQQNVFKLGPIKGFKKYNLGIYDEDYAIVEGREFKGPFQYIHKEFYRKGQLNAGASNHYTSYNNRYPKGYYSKDEDDSYFFNGLNYNNVKFTKSNSRGDNPSIPHGGKFPTIQFLSVTSSYIKVPHNPRFNFNTNEDFAISFYINPSPTGSQSDISNSEKRYILSKSTTKTAVSVELYNSSNIGLSESGSTLVDTIASVQYPFEIYLQSQSLYFQRSDGFTTSIINGTITASSSTVQREAHILCQFSSSIMQLYFNGTKISEASSNLTYATRNKADLYIGSKGKPDDTMLDDTGDSEYRTFNGKLDNINIYSKAFSTSQVQAISQSVNGSPYIGNIFYKSGLATITHPNYTLPLSGTAGTNATAPNGINTLQFQGTHLIYEHEYQCTVQEHEFNLTTNSTALKNNVTDPYELDPVTTGSFWKPYVTTIGLFNEDNELLVVGKLAQPIRMSDETDTTFIVRYDT